MVARMKSANGTRIILGIIALVFTMGASKGEPPLGPQNAPEPASGSSPSASDFVRLPQDMHCSLHNVQTTYGFGKDGEMRAQVVSIKTITCRIKGPEKDVPLVDTKVAGGILSTKNFCNFRVTQAGTPGVNPLLEVQSDKLQALREFLQTK